MSEFSETKKVAAIVAEYNPFHSGHKYHIERTRENGATHIIAVMSGAIVQRGEAAIFDKHFRARQAVIGGADLVIELPYPFSCSCAEVFAKGAISIITRLGIVDTLSFGCETDDTSLLQKCANISDELSDCDKISALTSQGLSYPAAFEEAVRERGGEEYANVFRSPNNTLAVEYIKALRLYNSDIKLLAVKRCGAAHDGDKPADGIASASYIRRLILAGKDASRFLPYDINSTVICDTNKMSKDIFMRIYQLVQSGSYAGVPDFSHELAQRFKKAASQSGTADFDAMLDAAKTKNFTRAKAARAFINAYLGVTHDDLKLVPHARVLAFNGRGQELLSAINKQGLGIEISTSLSDFSQKRLCELDDLSCRFQRFCFDNTPISEYTRKFSGFITDSEPFS